MRSDAAGVEVEQLPAVLPVVSASDFDLRRDDGSSKVRSLRDAIARFVEPGQTVHVAYSDARPNAAQFELVRRFAGSDAGLTLVTAGLVNAQHALVETGVVSRLVASFAGENFPVARPNPAFQRAVADGRVVIENWSLWTLTARLMAGALGLGFMPVRSLAGSSLADDLVGRGYLEIPASGDVPATSAVTPLRPDVVLLQGVAADRHGNVVMAPPYGEAYWGALAARRGVIACVETVVDTQTIRDLGPLVQVPGHRVLSVSEVPFGSHPYGAFSSGMAGVASYREDEAFIEDAYRASHSAEGFRQWIEEWLLAPESHAAYLAKLGEDRLTSLRARAEPEAWRQEFRTGWARGDADASRQEAVVVTAARHLTRRVRDERFQTVLAGVGLSNLAAWLAVSDLKRQNVDVELAAEIGMFGYDPRPGDPFIFSRWNVPTCKMLTDVTGVLGAIVGGPGTRCIGVVGAGQVDGDGNLNSTYLPDGTFLVGSGGANDITTTAEEVLVTVDHRPGRLVQTLPYVTCPGHRVRTLVTTLGVFERRPGGFWLTRYLPTAGGSARDAVERIRSRTGWDFQVAGELSQEPSATTAELAAARLFDPQRVFLR